MSHDLQLRSEVPILAAILVIALLIAALLGFQLFSQGSMSGDQQTTQMTQSTSQSTGVTASDLLPEHEIAYENGVLVNAQTGAALNVTSLQPVDMATKYPHLKVREGFEVKWAIVARRGGELIGFTVAIYIPNDKGFAIEPRNWEHGKFLFAPIDSPGQGLEYVQFMTNEVAASLKDKAYVEILSDDQFDDIIRSMRERAERLGTDITFLSTPPTNHTRIGNEGGEFVVERIYFRMIEREQILYSKSIVSRDGMVSVVSEFVYVMGVRSALP